MNWLKQNWKNFIMGILILLVLLITGGYAVIKYRTYEAMPEAVSLIETDGVQEEDDYYVIEPEEPTGNVVFYQGGLVETEAYLPLAQAISEQGFRVFVPSMPLNLAILKTNAFAEIYEENPSNLEWWIGGHSLGGTSALLYADEQPAQLKGAFLLGAYPSDETDLTDTDLEILSLYAENDGVINQDKYQSSQSLLPENTVYHVISGGNHSNFGHYGFQNGDGESSISREEQQQAVAEQFKQMTE